MKRVEKKSRPAAANNRTVVIRRKDAPHESMFSITLDFGICKGGNWI